MIPSGPFTDPDSGEVSDISYQLHTYKNNINAAANASKGWDGAILFLTTADGCAVATCILTVPQNARAGAASLDRTRFAGLTWPHVGCWARSGASFRRRRSRTTTTSGATRCSESHRCSQSRGKARLWE